MMVKIIGGIDMGLVSGDVTLVEVWSFNGELPGEQLPKLAIEENEPNDK